MGWFRASPADEVEGLDFRYHISTKQNTNEGHTARYGQRNNRLRRTFGDAMDDDFTENNIMTPRTWRPIGH